MTIFKRLHTILLIAGFLVSLPCITWAIPNLQIYIPDATYDLEMETWIINSYEYDLMVVGANLDIGDVKIAIAVPEGEDGRVEVSWKYGEHEALTLTETDGMDYDEYWTYYSGLEFDSSTYEYDTYAFGVASEGDYPTMGDGSEVPGHGVFPTDFYEYYIGDFGADEETVYNFNPPDDYPEDTYYIDYPGDLLELDSGRGEIKTFHIEVTGYSWADIVAYNHVVNTKGKAKYVFSPFSHDGESNPVPEPATMLLLGSGLLCLSLMRRKKR